MSEDEEGDGRLDPIRALHAQWEAEHVARMRRYERRRKRDLVLMYVGAGLSVGVALAIIFLGHWH